MVDAGRGSNYFIVNLIEDSVQIWHFAHLARKHAKQIRNDRTLFNTADHGEVTLLELFRKRVNTVTEHHLKTQVERDTLSEIYEEIATGIAPEREPIAIAQPLVREALAKKMQAQEGKPERGIALIRTMHQKILELEARVVELEKRLLDSPLPTDRVN